MPNTGEIELKADHLRYIWQACIGCGKERWVHLLKGKPVSIRCRNCNNNNETNPQWKGDSVGLNSLHRWVKRQMPKPITCPQCHDRPPYDLACTTGIYNRNLDNWRWLCRRCHMQSDGRFDNLKQASRLTKWDRKCYFTNNTCPNIKEVRFPHNGGVELYCGVTTRKLGITCLWRERKTKMLPVQE